MKIGLMGGTFDPIHLAHIAIAEQARSDLGLDEVIFIPAGQPYFKDFMRITPVADRLNMLNLALENRDFFTISLLEIERDGPSYSIDTLDYLKRKKYAQDQLFLILGWDNLLTLHLWKDPQRLLTLCTVVAAPRPDSPKPDVTSLENELPGISRQVFMMDKPLLDISSTTIRERVKLGLPIGDMVPPKVAQYIREKGLYLE